MTGNLNMATQSEVRFQDAVRWRICRITRAIDSRNSSYTVDLPPSAPTSGQVLQATSPSATQWATVGGSPTVAKSLLCFAQWK